MLTKGADVDPIIWAIVENCIGVVSASLPTMRPIYGLLVRGHYCGSERTCDRCHSSKNSNSNKSPLSPNSIGGGEKRVRKPGPARSWYDLSNRGTSDGKGSCCYSDNGSLEKGGAVTVEMY